MQNAVNNLVDKKKQIDIEIEELENIKIKDLIYKIQ